MSGTRLQRGVYTIGHSRHLVRVLCNERVCVGAGPKTPADNWTLIPYGDDLYAIYHTVSKRYVRAEGANVGCTLNWSSTLVAQWEIKFDSNGRAMICLAKRCDLSWSLKDDKSAVDLQCGSYVWELKMSPGQHSADDLFPDSQQLISGLKMSMNLAKAQAGENKKTFQINVENLPPSSEIKLPDSVLLTHVGHVVAEALPVKRPTSRPNSFEVSLLVKDPGRFGTLAKHVLQDEVVEVALRAENFSFVPSSGAIIESTYPLVKNFQVKGLDSFRNKVTLSEVEVCGNGGDHLRATAKATITNGSVGDLTAAIRVGVFTRGTKIGDANIKMLNLPIGTRTEVENWRLLPGHLERGNPTVLDFINDYLTTGNNLPISLVVDDISTDICGHKVVLPQLKLDSNLYIKGICAPFVTRVDAYIIQSFWKMLSGEFEVFVTFEFENPINALLTICSVDVEAYYGDILVTRLQKTFDSFTIPASGKEKSRADSPKFNVPLSIGFMDAISLFGEFLSSGALMAVKVVVKSAKVSVDGFVLEGLHFNLDRVSVRLNR
ncbi:hypothetical protein BD410DRAFT_792466 [Rickenella mellea]|uniref:Uncharacterized protein n=1 Tax=Rickenella mellea TaxID=50990 RepID=A0A4Y7PVX5_9AGAM|nr:hypothetical protein BD410DRAFT_792466 [Rickenella mellea]